MKYLRLMIFCLAIVSWQQSLSQNNFWTLPNESYNTFDNALDPLPSSGYSGSNSDLTHAGIKDPFGNIIFFVYDGGVYDGAGNLVENFIPGTGTLNGYSEVVIVNKPGSCNEYYIFLVGRTPVGHQVPYYAIYNSTTEQLEPIGSFNVQRLDNNFIPQWSFQPSSGSRGSGGIHIAATSILQNNTRQIYISNNDMLYRVDLDCTGLLANTWSYDFSVTHDISPYGWRSEMELYEDGAGNLHFAIPYEEYNNPAPNESQLWYVSINPITGNVVPNTATNIDLNNTSGSASYIHGLEFSPDGNLIYIMHDPSTAFPGPLSYYNITTGTITSITGLTNISDFSKSQLQIGGPANDRGLYMASDDYLGRLDDPDNPGGTWDDSFQPISSYSSNFGPYPSTSPRDEKHILPDQVDFQDYEAIFMESCECCETYAYAAETASTEFETTQSDIWEYGNNPWNAQVGDIIYIRDELRIKEGHNIEIRDMVFKFSPTAKAVVERGDDGPGAFLTLTDGTIFTADFRCADMNYPCAAGDCGREKWQGIIVEGFENNTAQSWTSSTPHGRLLVDDNSMIEFAVEGARAGGNTVSSSGGGMIRLDDAIIKDCITGLRFDPYIKLSGSSEVYTRSRINNSSFITTGDWFGSVVPNAFVYVHGSSGINLNANSFENQIPGSFSNSERGLGIYSINSRLTNNWACASQQINCPQQDIIRSSFKNLFYGIFGFNTGSSARTIYDYHSKYTNNFIGVLLDNLVNPEILDGTFEIMPSVDATGIYLNASTGYIIENNVLETYNGLSNNRNIGIYVSDSGIEHNEIYRNFFNNLTRGGVSVGLNADPNQRYVPGLDWICNEFSSPIHQADLYVDGYISEEQGLCASPDVPADNLFSYSGSGHYDLYMTTQTPFQLVDYNYSDNQNFTGLNLEPLTISDNNALEDFNPDQCLVLYSKSTCPVKKTSLPQDIEGPKDNDETSFTVESISEMAEVYSEQINELEDVVEELGEDVESYELNELESVHFQNDQFWQDVSSYYMRDTTGAISEDEMIDLLNEFQPRAVERFSSILTGVYQAWVDSLNCSIYQNEMGLDLPELDDTGNLPTELSDFYENGYFSFHGNTCALNAYYVEHNSYYHAYVIDSEIEGISQEDKSLASSADENRVLVQPNPFSNQVLFDISELNLEDQPARIKIYDLVGKRVLETIVSSSQTQIQLDGSNLPSGYLTFSIAVGGEVIETGKLLHINQ